MAKCKKCGSDVGVTDIDLFSGICGKCRQKDKEDIKKQNSQYSIHLRSHPLKNHEHLAIPATTTASYPRYEITEVRGVICGETVMGANFLKDLLSGFTDTFGGRSGAYESELRDGRAIALSELKYEAYQLGANCIVGVSIDYETVGGKMFMIIASGTAVTVVPSENWGEQGENTNPDHVLS